VATNDAQDVEAFDEEFWQRLAARWAPTNDAGPAQADPSSFSASCGGENAKETLLKEHVDQMAFLARFDQVPKSGIAGVHWFNSFIERHPELYREKKVTANSLRCKVKRELQKEQLLEGKFAERKSASRVVQGLVVKRPSRMSAESKRKLAEGKSVKRTSRLSTQARSR